MRLRKMQSRHYVKTIALEFCLLKIKKYKTEPKEKNKRTTNQKKEAQNKTIPLKTKLAKAENKVKAK